MKNYVLLNLLLNYNNSITILQITIELPQGREMAERTIHRKVRGLKTGLRCHLHMSSMVRSGHGKLKDIDIKKWNIDTKFRELEINMM